jgi:hypothetical protein
MRVERRRRKETEKGNSRKIRVKHFPSGGLRIATIDMCDSILNESIVRPIKEISLITVIDIGRLPCEGAKRQRVWWSVMNGGGEECHTESCTPSDTRCFARGSVRIKGYTATVTSTRK